MAYTRFKNGFDVTTASAIDKRILLSKQEMLQAEDALNLPDNYFCICKDDGKLYIWNIMFDVDPELGRFRSYEQIMNVSQAINTALSAPETREQIEQAISGTIPGAIEDAMLNKESADKIANAMFDSDHFQTTIDNKIDLAISVIQAIDGN